MNEKSIDKVTSGFEFVRGVVGVNAANAHDFQDRLSCVGIGASVETKNHAAFQGNERGQTDHSLKRDSAQASTGR